MIPKPPQVSGIVSENTSLCSLPPITTYLHTCISARGINSIGSSISNPHLAAPRTYISSCCLVMALDLLVLQCRAKGRLGVCWVGGKMTDGRVLFWNDLENKQQYFFIQESSIQFEMHFSLHSINIGNHFSEKMGRHF